MSEQYLRTEKADESIDDVAAWDFDGNVGASCVSSVPSNNPFAGNGIGMKEVGDMKGA